MKKICFANLMHPASCPNAGVCGHRHVDGTLERSLLKAQYEQIPCKIHFTKENQRRECMRSKKGICPFNHKSWKCEHCSSDNPGNESTCWNCPRSISPTKNPIRSVLPVPVIIVMTIRFEYDITTRTNEINIQDEYMT